MPSAYVHNLPSDAKRRERLKLLASYLLSLDGKSPDDGPTTWLLPVRWEPLDIDPEIEADGLVGNVFKFLAERYGVNGHRGNAMTFEKMPLKSIAAYGTNDSELPTKLGFVYYKDSLYTFILGNQSVPDDTNTRPWIEALAYAEQEKSAGHPFHEWLAVIGPTGSNNGQVPILRAAELRLGELELQPCNFAYDERRTLPSLSGWESFSWVPVVLRGRSQGHHWRAAEFAALRQVHRLCALLSVETACHWTLKESPQPTERGPVQFPDETPLGLTKKTENSDEAIASTPTPIIIDSARLARMWNRCLDDASLSVPVEAYHEAVSLRESHPSFALVGFVSTIEEIGKLLIDVPTTERCPTCNKERTSSSAERFRAALRLVLPEDKLQDVSRNLYRWRSGTAHAGRTYSWENSFGRPQMGDSMLVSPPQSTFSVRGTMRADELARDLLLVLLDPPQKNNN